MKHTNISRRNFALGLAGAALTAAAPRFASAQARPAARDALTPDEALIAAAKREGSVTLYGSSNVIALKSDADGFQKTYGIPVNFTQLVSSPLVARVDQEIKGGGISPDVVINSDVPAIQRWIAAGQMARIPAIGYPQQTEHFAPIQVVFQGLFYNTFVFTKQTAPKAWSDLLAPQFKNKIVLGSPRIAAGYSLLYYAILKSPKYGVAYFEALAKQTPRVVAAPGLVAQMVTAGEASVGFVALPYDAINIQKTNPSAPISYAYLDVVTAGPAQIAINAKAQHPNAARLFAYWMMSPAGQIAHNGDGRASSVLGNLPGTAETPDLKLVDPLTVEAAANDYQSILALFDRLFR